MQEEINLSTTESRAEVIPLQDQADLVPSAESGEQKVPSRRRRRRHRRRHPKVDLSRVRPGQQYQGRVVSLAKFGAFVDIGLGRDGLLHISELKEGFVDKVDSVVAVGDEVTVWVKSVDPERGRISLTMIEPSAERRSLNELEPGMVLKGTVEGVAPFGAFVDIGAQVNGLVHISEMAEGYVAKPQNVVSPGDQVKVRVLKVDRDHRKISLSMKGLHTAYAPPRRERRPALTAMQLAWQRALAAKKAGERSR